MTCIRTFCMGNLFCKLVPCLWFCQVLLSYCCILPVFYLVCSFILADDCSNSVYLLVRKSLSGECFEIFNCLCSCLRNFYLSVSFPFRMIWFKTVCCNFQALSGLDYSISRRARFLGNTALDAALNAQFLVQIGIFTAVPMIMGFILELGLMKVILCSFSFGKMVYAIYRILQSRQNFQSCAGCF